MDKYTVRDLYISGNGSDEVYLASEMDARVAELEEVVRVYARHRANCMIHHRDECTCGWEAKKSVL